jgi:hypothetical protein
MLNVLSLDESIDLVRIIGHSNSLGTHVVIFEIIWREKMEKKLSVLTQKRYMQTKKIITLDFKLILCNIDSSYGQNICFKSQLKDSIHKSVSVVNVAIDF